MKLLSVLSLTIIVICTSGQDTDCIPDLAPCSDVHDIAKITCSVGDEACKLVKGDLAANDDLGYLQIPAITSIDVDVCSKKCKEQADHDPDSDHKCQFYRWEDDRDGNSQCSLQTSCDIPDPWCDESNRHCMTGQIGCTDDGEPDPIPCSLITTTEYNKDKFHVICIDMSGSVGEINIYNPDMIAVIPPGTVCITSRKCAAWAEQDATPKADYHRKLAVYCDGEEGSWKAREDSGSAEFSEKMIAVENTIVEQECSTIDDPCGDLVLTHTDQQGFDLICETPLQDNTLSGDNSCILLCDNHLTLAIDCGMSEEGDKMWLDDWGEVLTDDDIKC